MKKITFSSCNTPNLDCHNVANAFIKRMNVKTVVGFDGGAYFDYSDKKLKKGIGAQTTWWNYVPKVQVYDGYVGFISVPFSHEEAARERMGIRTYKNGKWSELIWRPVEVMN